MYTTTRSIQLTLWNLCFFHVCTYIRIFRWKTTQYSSLMILCMHKTTNIRTHFVSQEEWDWRSYVNLKNSNFLYLFFMNFLIDRVLGRIINILTICLAKFCHRSKINFQSSLFNIRFSPFHQLSNAFLIVTKVGHFGT